jgi:hypothetical protein
MCNHNKQFLVMKIYPKNIKITKVDTKEVADIFYCPSCKKSRIIGRNIYTYKEHPWYETVLYEHTVIVK